MKAVDASHMMLSGCLIRRNTETSSLSSWAPEYVEQWAHDAIKLYYNTQKIVLAFSTYVGSNLNSLCYNITVSKIPCQTTSHKAGTAYKKSTWISVCLISFSMTVLRQNWIVLYLSVNFMTLAWFTLVELKLISFSRCNLNNCILNMQSILKPSSHWTENIGSMMYVIILVPLRINFISPIYKYAVQLRLQGNYRRKQAE